MCHLSLNWLLFVPNKVFLTYFCSRAGEIKTDINRHVGQWNRIESRNKHIHIWSVYDKGAKNIL